MYKYIYKSLGALTLLWACSGGNMRAAGTKYSSKYGVQISDYFYSYKSENVASEEMKKSLCNIICLPSIQQRTTDQPQPKRNAVMVFGTPTCYLREIHVDIDNIDINVAKTGLPRLEKFSMEPKPYLARENITDKTINHLIDKTINRLIKEWKTRLYRENVFMKSTFCKESYTQYYVQESFYLPTIYCPAPEDNNNPIYIVVPSLPQLVKGIFFESIGIKYDETKRCRKRFDACIDLFNEYMGYVYDLVDIKALVINYDCSFLRDSTAYQQHLNKLERIDISIHQFGKLLYKNKVDEQYPINPQVFWLHWYKDEDIKDRNIRNKEAAFYCYLEAGWFNTSMGDTIDLDRQASLLYPFVRAHEPADLQKNWAGVAEVREEWKDIPLANKKDKQMVLLNIDGALGEQAAALQVFNSIKSHLIKIVNCKTNVGISHHLFRFEFAMRYQYISLHMYSRDPTTNNLTVPEIKKFLRKQCDTPRDHERATSPLSTIEKNSQYWHQLKEDELLLWEELNKEHGDMCSSEDIASMYNSGKFQYIIDNYGKIIAMLALILSSVILYIIYAKDLMPNKRTDNKTHSEEGLDADKTPQHVIINHTGTEKQNTSKNEDADKTSQHVVTNHTVTEKQDTSKNESDHSKHKPEQGLQGKTTLSTFLGWGLLIILLLILVNISLRWRSKK